MTVFPVTQNANKISGVFSRPYLVRNSGSEVVYLGQDSSLTVGTQSITMNPGGTLNWAGDTTELWALCDPGKTSALELLYTGDSAFTPGPDVVTTRLIYDTLYDGPVTPIPSPFGSSILVNNVSTDQYQSLHIAISSPAPLTCSTPVFILQVRQFSASGLIVANAEPSFSGTGTFTIPLVGTYVTVTLVSLAPYPGGVNRAITISATNAILARSYTHDPGSIGSIVNASSITDQKEYVSMKIASVEYVTGTGGTTQWFVPTSSGMSTFAMRTTGSAAAGSSSALRMFPGNYWPEMYNRDTPNIIADQDRTNLVLPEAPIIIETTAVAQPRRYRLALTYP